MREINVVKLENVPNKYENAGYLNKMIRLIVNWTDNYIKFNIINISNSFIWGYELLRAIILD